MKSIKVLILSALLVLGIGYQPILADEIVIESGTIFLGETIISRSLAMGNQETSSTGAPLRVVQARWYVKKLYDVENTTQSPYTSSGVYQIGIYTYGLNTNGIEIGELNFFDIYKDLNIRIEPISFNINLCSNNNNCTLTSGVSLREINIKIDEGEHYIDLPYTIEIIEGTTDQNGNLVYYKLESSRIGPLNASYTVTYTQAGQKVYLNETQFKELIDALGNQGSIDQGTSDQIANQAGQVEQATNNAIQQEQQYSEDMQGQLDDINVNEYTGILSNSKFSSSMNWIRQVHAQTIENSELGGVVTLILIIGLAVYLIGRRAG